jgi:RHS repeat-associated protein
VFASSVREAAQLRYISLNGSLVAVDKLDTGTGAVSVVYQHTDALGSPVATTNASRTVIERREYEPYGCQVAPFALEDGPGYTGHMADAATGLVYMQQRYYDPLIGFFLSRDEVTALQAGPRHFNGYAYAANNPYRFTDPDGRYECEKGVCDAVRAGLKAVRSAMRASSNREARSALGAVLRMYGKEGKANGVVVKSIDVGMASTETKGGTTTISVNVSEINRQADMRATSHDVAMGAQLSHEGQHGLDQRADGMPATKSEEMSGERRAATTEARAWQVMGTDAWWKTYKRRRD